MKNTLVFILSRTSSTPKDEGTTVDHLWCPLSANYTVPHIVYKFGRTSQVPELRHSKKEELVLLHGDSGRVYNCLCFLGL